jgi:phosphatidate phosphatase APP1
VEYKRAAIERILTDFPDRKFVLIGDSGEQDPEVFGELARKHSAQVVHVFIRQIDAGQVERLEKAFEKLPRNKWMAFKEVDELKAAVKPKWFIR